MASASDAEKRTARLNFRVTPREETLIRAAARVRGAQVSRYVVESACRQAEMDLADRRHFTISAQRMEAFIEALDRPVRDKPRLRRLLAEPSVLERE